MNFLAHLWLADRTATSLAGAVLGDVVRGVDLSAYPEAIALGIRLHRRIDAATDRHPLIVAARERFPEGERRYAGIVLDLACDHVLARDFDAFHAEPLEAFCRRAGTAIAAAAPWFERAGGRVSTAESFSRLLLSYAEPAGIERALVRTAARLRQPQGLLQSGRRWPESLVLLRPGLAGLLADLQQVTETLSPNPSPASGRGES